MNRIEEIKAQIAELQEALKAAEQEQEAGRAKRGDTYWILTCAGKTLIERDARSGFDDKCFAMGNYYLTKEEAIKARDRQLAKMRVIRKMREIERKVGWVADWTDITQDKYVVERNHDRSIIRISCYGSIQFVEPELYTCREAANYIVKNMANDVKLMLGAES